MYERGCSWLNKQSSLSSSLYHLLLLSNSLLLVLDQEFLTNNRIRHWQQLPSLVECRFAILITCHRMWYIRTHYRTITALLFAWHLVFLESHGTVRKKKGYFNGFAVYLVDFNFVLITIHDYALLLFLVRRFFRCRILFSRFLLCLECDRRFQKIRQDLRKIENVKLRRENLLWYSLALCCLFGERNKFCTTLVLLSISNSILTSVNII